MKLLTRIPGNTLIPDYGVNVIRSGLIQYLDITSYPKTGTTWYDRSGSGNNATLINSPVYSSNYTGSIICDGVNDYIATTINLSNNQTISLWFVALSLNYGGLIKATASTTWGSTMFELNIAININGLNIWGYSFNGVRDDFNLGNFPIEIGKIYNLVISWVNGVGYGYLNSNFLGSDAPAITNFDGMTSKWPYRLSINTGYDQSYQWPTVYANAAILNWSIYNRSLSSAEILYNFEILRNIYRT